MNEAWNEYLDLCMADLTCLADASLDCALDCEMEHDSEGEDRHWVRFSQRHLWLDGFRAAMRENA